jgi:hypothetical protein
MGARSRSIHAVAAGVVSTGVLAGATLSGAIPTAEAAPGPMASFVSAGAHGTVPQAPAVEPVRFGPGGFGHGGFGPGGFGPGGVHRGFGHGWGHPGGFWRHGRWWNWWW